MVLEIRLSNFYSIKDEVIIDFRAGKIQTKQALELKDNVFDFEEVKVLKSIAIYGANASGKSNIIKAIRFCSSLVLSSHQNNIDDIFDFMPFKFEGYNEKPSSFFIRFVIDNIEYEYSFTITKNEILEESLFFYPKGRITKIFYRNEKLGVEKKDKYSFGSFIKRPLDVAENTSVKSLYISRASQMDREIGKSIFNFFSTQFIVNYNLANNSNIEYYYGNYKELLLIALQIADSDIADILIEKETVQTGFLQEPKSDPNSGFITLRPQMSERIKFKSTHKNSPEIFFDFKLEESEGTKKLFYILLTIIDVIRNNKVLILDEFEEKLHPRILEFILKLFNASSDAQILFTTHNTNLLNLKKLRKDQVYFCNKKSDSSTDLYSLYDYKDFRETMDVEKAYLDGRFDAVPFLDDSIQNIKALIYE